MSKKIKCALIGPGNIGTDLLYKLLRSEVLEPVWMVGIDATSEGLSRAREMGLKTTSDGVDGLLEHVLADNIQIAFDATSAYVHAENSRKLNALGVLMIDLTPAAIGPYCVPPVNLKANLKRGAMNVNMVTCGGQATIPLVAAVSSVQPVAYAEIVATAASKSVGPGTRKNIDEFTRTTASAIEQVQQYVPGYKLVNGPVFDGNRVSIFMEVEGLGDYLPKYAGNLDIMTAAAARTAEMFAEEILKGELQLKASTPQPALA